MHRLSLDAAVAADRTAALRVMSPANRAKVLVALPEVAAAAWGRGALAATDFGQRRSRQARDASVEGIAKLIADPTVIHLTIDCLDECARNLLALAKWYGAPLPPNAKRPSAVRWP